MDALFRLVTPDGVQQAWNHDFVSLDPRLSWQSACNGSYILQVMGFKYPADSEVRFTGGEGCVYRLHVELLTKPPDQITGGAPEHEPNSTPADAPVLTLPATVRGTIDGPGDEDSFGFKLDKDESVEVRVEAASLGSPLDAWVKLVDSQAKELARNDEIARFRDPRLVWKAPTNGVFYAVVGNMLHAGGPAYGYRLSVRQLTPEYTATLPRARSRSPPGKRTT